MIGHREKTAAAAHSRSAIARRNCKEGVRNPTRRERRRIGQATALWLGFALGHVFIFGCVVEPVVHDVSDEGLPRLDWSDWGLVLNRAVMEDRVDYRKILADPAPLERTLAMIARVGPKTTPDLFPDGDSRIAYYINCYNVTILRSIVALARNGDVPDKAPTDLDIRFRYRVDGELWSPADLREKVVALAGNDWRVWFALCDGRRGGPPLHPRPILGELLDGQLNFVTRMALYAPGVVQIDHGAEHRILLWRGLYSIKDRMIADYQARMGTTHATILNVLGEWSNRLRREYLNTAIGYSVAEHPFDQRINKLEEMPQPAGLKLF